MTFLALVLAFALPTGVVEAVRIDQVGLRPAVTVRKEAVKLLRQCR